MYTESPRTRCPGTAGFGRVGSLWLSPPDDDRDVLLAVHRVGDRRRGRRRVHQRRLPQLGAGLRVDRREVAEAVLGVALAEVADERQSGRGVDRAAVARRLPLLVPAERSARGRARSCSGSATEKLPKSFRFSGSMAESGTERMPAPMPPAEPTTCDDAGICSLRVGAVGHAAGDERVRERAVRAGRPVHRLERRHDVLGRVVRIEVAPDLVRLPVRRGLAGPASRIGAEHDLPLPVRHLVGSQELRSGSAGSACVLAVFTSGAVLCGTVDLS